MEDVLNETFKLNHLAAIQLDSSMTNIIVHRLADIDLKLHGQPARTHIYRYFLMSVELLQLNCKMIKPNNSNL